MRVVKLGLPETVPLLRHKKEKLMPFALSMYNITLQLGYWGN